MDIEQQVEALFENETLQSLRYWLDNYPQQLPEERQVAARIALHALIVLAAWYAEESRPVIWTLSRLTDRVRERLRAEGGADEAPPALIDFASRQVVLELSERDLIFPIAGDRGRLTLDNVDAASFIVKTWGSAEVQDYGEFLQAVCEIEPVDTSRE